MTDWSSGVKRRFSMAVSRRRKSSVSFFPGIPQSPPWRRHKVPWQHSHHWRHGILRRLVFRMHSGIQPGWDNSRSQRLADRRPASVAREGLPASHRRCDNFFHCWPEGETYFTVSQNPRGMLFPHSSDVTPGRQCGIFPVDTERLWHHWSHHCREGDRVWEWEWVHRGNDMKEEYQETDRICKIYYYFFTHSSRKTSMYFPKRLELSFRTVLAFPKDSSRGAASRIYREINSLCQNLYFFIGLYSLIRCYIWDSGQRVKLLPQSAI